ncbi:MAG: hypothetical protein RLZZ142_1389 [Verrucomicrobiota bacterium]
MNCRSRVIPGTLEDVSGGGILSKKRERAQFRGGTVRVARGGDWETIDSYVWGSGEPSRTSQRTPQSGRGIPGSGTSTWESGNASRALALIESMAGWSPWTKTIFLGAVLVR